MLIFFVILATLLAVRFAPKLAAIWATGIRR